MKWETWPDGSATLEIDDRSLRRVLARQSASDLTWTAFPSWGPRSRGFATREEAMRAGEEIALVWLDERVAEFTALRDELRGRA